MSGEVVRWLVWGGMGCRGMVCSGLGWGGFVRLGLGWYTDLTSTAKAPLAIMIG